MDDVLELDELDTLSEVEKSISEELVYPSLLIEGVSTQEEVMFLKKHSTGGLVLPLYVKFGNLIKCIGKFSLTLENLLLLKSIGTYDLKLCKSIDKVRDIKLDIPQELVKFVSL